METAPNMQPNCKTEIFFDGMSLGTFNSYQEALDIILDIWEDAADNIEFNQFGDWCRKHKIEVEQEL